MSLSYVQDSTQSTDYSRLEAHLDRLARKVVQLRLESPVQFFLEAHLPFVTIFQTAGLLLEPIATPLFGTERILTFRMLFSDRKNIEELIRRIEIYSIAKRKENEKG